MAKITSQELVLRDELKTLKNLLKTLTIACEGADKSMCMLYSDLDKDRSCGRCPYKGTAVKDAIWELEGRLIKLGVE